MTIDRTINVFLSHSSKDKPFVRLFDKALLAYGIKTFLDERDIQIGEDIPEKLVDAIKTASHICYIISTNSINSKWVKDELSKAAMIEKERDGTFILPVLIEKIDIPTVIINKRYADFTEETDKPIHERSAFRLLLKALDVDPSDFEPERLPSKMFVLDFAQSCSMVTRDLLTIRIRADQIRSSSELPNEWRSLYVVYKRLMQDFRSFSELAESNIAQLNQLKPYLAGTDLEAQSDTLISNFELLLGNLKDILPNQDNLEKSVSFMSEVIDMTNMVEFGIHSLLVSLLYFAKDEKF